MKFKINQAADVTTVAFRGDINESFVDDTVELAKQLATKRVVFDCEAVGRINSIGVSGWASLLGDLSKRHVLAYTRCPAGFIDYVNLVDSFRAGGTIESFYVPLYCKKCDRKGSVLVESLAANPAGPLPTVPCPKCAAPMQPEVEAEDFLQFLGG
jgi:hypothetical protein